jgi:hypothetical protein
MREVNLVNVEFSTRLAQLCWANMMQDERHSKHLMDWLMFKLQGCWVDIEKQPKPCANCRRDDRPDDSDWTGHTMTALVLSVNPNDCYYSGSGKVYTTEFSWVFVRYDTDKWGTDAGGGRRRLMNGGLVDHSPGHETPNWSSHT